MLWLLDLEMENNIIIQGDCIKEMKKLPENSIDAIITDPPFNIGKKYGKDKDNKKLFEYYGWCYNWIDECIRVLKQTGNLYIMNFPRHLAFLYVHLIKRGMIYKNWISWVRNDITYVKGNSKEKVNHPCPWPIKLVERMLLSSSKEGDTILDPFGGSGTTMVACIKNNRKCILIEKEEEYIKVIKSRIKPYLEQTQLK